MAEDHEAKGCVRLRSIGTIPSQIDPENFVQVHHVTSACSPGATGAVSLQLLHQLEGEDKPHEDGSVILGIGEALAVANRIQRACDLAMSVHEEPEDADLALARILGTEEDAE